MVMLVVLDENLGDQWDSSSGDHGFLYKVSCQSIKLKYFSLDQSGGPTGQQTGLTITKAIPLAWLKTQSPKSKNLAMVSLN